MRAPHKPVMRLHLWLETKEGLYFGLGRSQLLKSVQKNRSLKKAAEELGMSYRAAWGKIKKTEEVMGIRLLEKRDGNRYQVTKEGELFMNCFEQWFEEVERFALERARSLFPCIPQEFESKPEKSER